MVIVFLPLTLAVVVGLVWTWVLTFREMRAVATREWRQTVAVISELAVSVQLVLLFVEFFLLIHPIDQRFIAWITWSEALLFFIAVPCALIRKGPTRWFLAVSAFYFLAFTGFVYAVSGIQF